MTQQKPNILIIVTDQLRSDCVSCYHGYPVKTPNLDALSKEGMVFEQCYTPQPLCCPARQSIISSRRPEKNGGICNYDAATRKGTRWLNPSSEFWPAQLKDMGYRNFYFGKWHVSPEHTPIDFGYEKYVSHNEYNAYRQKGYNPDNQNDRTKKDVGWLEWWMGKVDDVPLEYSATHWLSGMAEEQIEACAREKGPWHIRLDFTEPHLPCQPCKEFYQLYEKDEIPEWIGFRETFEDKPYIQKQQLYNWGVENMTWEDWREVVKRYYAVISQIDDAVGRVIRKLKDTDQWENTLIIFTADHGDMCGSHGMMDKHYIFYDDVVHIPFIAVWPGKISSGTRNDQFIYQALDLGPTIMELTGGHIENTDGRSLVPLLQGKTPSDWRQEVVSSYNGNQFGLYTQRMLRTREWKYIWNLTDVDELYDLTNDAGELHNLVHDPKCQDILKEYRKRLQMIMEKEGDDLATDPWLITVLLDEGRIL